MRPISASDLSTSKTDAVVRCRCRRSSRSQLEVQVVSRRSDVVQLVGGRRNEDGIGLGTVFDAFFGLRVSANVELFVSFVQVFYVRRRRRWQSWRKVSIFFVVLVAAAAASRFRTFGLRSVAVVEAVVRRNWIRTFQIVRRNRIRTFQIVRSFCRRSCNRSHRSCRRWRSTSNQRSHLSVVRRRLGSFLHQRLLDQDGRSGCRCRSFFEVLRIRDFSGNVWIAQVQRRNRTSH